MTLDELKGLVSRVFPPEEANTFNEAADLLVDFDAQEFTDTFELALGPHYYGAESEAVDEVRFTMLGLTKNLVKTHGITLAEDLFQYQVNIVLRTLLELPTWTDRDRLVDILGQDISDEDKFCEFVCEITCTPTETALTWIDEVKLDLYDAISQAIKQETLEDEQQADARKIENYQTFRSKTSSKELWSDRFLLLKNIGAESFTALLALWSIENLALLGGENGKIDYGRLSEELIGLAVVSEVGMGGALQAITDHQTEIFRDLPRALALTTAVKNKYLEINNG